MSKLLTRFRPWLGLIIFFALAIIAHEWLKRVMLEEQVVASLLSPGPHLRLDELGIALGFLMLRMVVVFCLPGMLLCHAGLAAFDRFRRARTASPSD